MGDAHPPTLGGVSGVETKRVDEYDRELRRQGNGPGKTECCEQTTCKEDDIATLCINRTQSTAYMYIHFSHGPVNPGRLTNRVYMHELNMGSTWTNNLSSTLIRRRVEPSPGSVEAS